MITILQGLKSHGTNSIDTKAFADLINLHKYKCNYLQQFLKEEMTTKHIIHFNIDLWVPEGTSEVLNPTADDNAAAEIIYQFYRVNQGIFELILDVSVTPQLDNAYKINEKLFLDKNRDGYIVRYDGGYEPHKSLITAFASLKEILMKEYPEDDLTLKIQ